MEKGRQRRPPRCRPSRPQAQAESPTTPTSRASFAPRSARPRLRNRSVDAAPGGESDRALNRRALSPRPRVEDLARPGLEPATSRQTSPRTQAGESAALADPDLAGDKKKARRRKAWILFQDESGVSQRPSIRRTWAPKGQTPVLIHAFNWSKMSVCAAIGYCWDGRRSRLFFLSNPTRQLQLGKPDPFSARSPPALAGQEGHSGVGRVTSSQKAAS